MAQADSIVPGAGNPLAFDRYAYTLNNPLRYTDPTGHASEEKEKDKQCRYRDCQFWISIGIEFLGTWTPKEIAYVIKALNMIRNAMGTDAMRKALGLEKGLKLMGYTKEEWNETFCPGKTGCNDQPFYSAGTNTIHFFQPKNSVSTVIHEIGHAVDHHAGGGPNFSTTRDWYGWELRGVLKSPGVRGETNGFIQEKKNLSLIMRGITLGKISQKPSLLGFMRKTVKPMVYGLFSQNIVRH
ncbi:MAG: hypothetical protein Fur0022_29740 [Anaerolineales bacterium]